MNTKIEKSSAAAANASVTERTYALRQDIVPDPNQPRKHFDPAKLKELAADLALNGVAVDLIVLPKNAAGKYPLVDGERRWRAADLIELERLPISVRALTPEQVTRIQLVSQQQRENLTELEEAAAFEKEITARRLADPKFSVDTLAKELGVARATIYNRLALLKLSPALRAALLAGTLDTSKAGLIAQIPDPKVQAEVLATATKEDKWGAPPMSVRQLKEHIAEEHMVNLKHAPFDVNADYLAPVGDAKAYKKGAPAVTTLPTCAACPQRSGNLKELFPDIGSPDMCTDPACFRVKCGVALSAKGSTARVLSDKEWSKARYSSQYTEADDKCYEDGKGRSWKQVLGDKAPPLTLALDTDRGQGIQVKKLYDRQAALKIAKDNKLFAAKQKSTGDSAYEKKHKEEQAKRKAQEAQIKVAQTAMVLKASNGYPKLTLEFWKRLASTTVITHEYDIDESVLTGRSLKNDESGDEVGTLCQYIRSQQSPENLIGLIVDVLTASLSSYGPDGNDLGQVLTVWGVDWKKASASKPAAPVKAPPAKPKPVTTKNAKPAKVKGKRKK